MAGGFIAFHLSNNLKFTAILTLWTLAQPLDFARVAAWNNLLSAICVHSVSSGVAWGNLLHLPAIVQFLLLVDACLQNLYDGRVA